MPSLDAVVVGGGISGLVVADGLLRGGLTVKVVEARPHLGGRMVSVPVDGGQADLGATWFWPSERRVRALVDRFALRSHQQWSTGNALIWSNGHIRRADWRIEPAFRFSDGTSAVVAAIADQLPSGTIDVDSPVERIEDANIGVRVHLADTTLEARLVVVALPPSLAVATGIIDRNSLDPNLAAAASNIPVWMGTTLKAVAVFADPFWRTAGLSGDAWCPGAPLHEIHDMSGPDGRPAMLFGFGQTTDRHPEVTEATIAAQLAALFGPLAASPLEVTQRDWRLEERTSPRYQPPSQRYDLFGSPLLQRPTWHGRLHWTSTETSAVAPGHIDGALAAAERTVRTILGQQTCG